MKRVLIVSIAIFVVIISPSLANWLLIPIRINASKLSMFSNAWGPQICTSGDKVFVAWVEYDNDGEAIYFNYSTDSGKSWQDSDTLITSSRYGDLGNLRIACQGDSVYLVWMIFYHSSWTNISGRALSEDISVSSYILFNCSQDGGRSWQDSNTSFSYPDPESLDYGPEIACEGDNVYVIWDASNSQKILFNKSSDRGITWLDYPVRIDEKTGYHTKMFPKIACSDDSVYVVWSDRRDGGNQMYDIYFDRSHDAGETWLDQDIRLDTGSLPGEGWSINPDICGQGNNVYVVWNNGQHGRDFHYEVRFNRSLDRGVNWMAQDIRLDRGVELPLGRNSDPQIACGGRNVYVAWAERRDSTPNSQVYFNFSSDQGAVWQTQDIRLDRSGIKNTIDWHYVNMVSSGNNVYVSWADKRNGEADIYFNQSINGGAEWLDQDVRIDTGDPPGHSDSYSPKMAFSAGRLHVVWHDARDGDGSNIYINSKIKSYRLIVSSSEGGKTNPQVGEYTYLAGEEATITALPAHGYGFSHWSGYVRSGESEENPLTIAMDGDKRIHANFVRKFKLRLGAGKGGTTDPSPGKQFYDIGSWVKVTAIPAEGYRFQKWTGDIAKKANPVNIKMNSNMWVRARFLKQRTLMVHANQGGTTKPAAGSYTYDNGTKVRIEAKPDLHYEFAGWSGDVYGASNPCTFALWEDKNVSALFRRMIYAPIGVAARRVENRSLSFSEYLDILQWQPNPYNVDIVKYRIYRVDGITPVLVAEVEANTFRYQISAPGENVSATYSVCAVNSGNREGLWTTATVDGSSEN